jgi:hypothetical protein
LADKPAIAGTDEKEQKLNEKPVVPPTNLDINNGNKSQTPSPAEKPVPVVEPIKPMVIPTTPPVTPFTPPVSAPVDKELKKPIVEPVVPPRNLDKNNGNKIQTPSPADKPVPIVEPMKPIVMPTTPTVTPITPPVSMPAISPVPTPPVPKAPASPAINGHHGKTVPDNKPVESKPKDVEKPKVPELPTQNEFGVLPPRPKANVVNTKPKIRDATTDFLAMEQGLPRYTLHVIL